jgi:toxin ParE1/3/4
MKKYRLDRDAAADLKAIYQYIASDNRPAALRQIKILHSKFALLATQPYMGESRNDLGPKLRSFVAGNYLIIYRTSRRQIQIARVIHAARDIKALFPSE